MHQSVLVSKLMYVTTCCPRLVCQLNMLFQKKSVPVEGKIGKQRTGAPVRAGCQRCHLHRFTQNLTSASQSDTWTLMHTHTHTYSPLTPYNILNIGPPDGSSTWQKSKARAHQANQQNRSRLVWLVTLQVVIQPHASFYVAFLAAPILRSAISEGIIS